jgi:hypothetical protein
MTDARALPLVPAWFRAASVLAVLWSLIGVAMYLQSVGIFGDALSGLSDAERTLAESVPAWVTGTFALAVFSSLLGSFGLLLRKRWAHPVLVVSLIAVLVQESWVLFVSNAVAVHGPAVVVAPLTITLVSALLVWLANSAGRRGWLS